MLGRPFGPGTAEDMASNSATDIVRAINNEPDYTKAGNYWRWLKRKLVTQGLQFVSDTHKLKNRSRSTRIWLDFKENMGALIGRDKGEKSQV